MSYGDPPPNPPQPPSYGGGQPPTYGGQPAYGGGAAAAGNNKKAIWSLVTGILGLFCCSPLGIVAIILSTSAKKEMAATGQGGKGLATAGLVLGILAIVALVITIILAATGSLSFSGSASTS